ncbi:hypothetical protein Q4Q35_02605 [Flavivirga aquimarina]|uniref:Uncharacterized protein n=1 Tax=Flavivirga aquimarina TaxID=2027862 RepID=A0ABT8W6E5_9FLAO|nr:hypothetical protein [Flavivirga aquimarina]MDO5968688.1 hypothetical protein [Flavivirga aquimarina]
MKKGAYILLIVLGFSCKRESNKAPLFEAADIDYETVIESNTLELSEINSYETLSIEKLKEYFDLVKLKNQHTKFNEDITLQLKNYTSENLIDFKLSERGEIENVRQIGEIQKISDSLSRIQLEFNITFDNTRFKDFVFAYITSKTVLIDGGKLKSNKVRFSRE